MNTLITYDIVSDKDGKLKDASKIACNFWNRFIIPKTPIVIRLGTFKSKGFVIARAYKPYSNKGIVYGPIEFNVKYLDLYDALDIAGTVIHEIGHTLGMGWDKWMDMFDRYTGEFKPGYWEEVPDLQDMTVETEFGPGTQYSHWDEKEFNLELMTGFKDPMEEVLPVTIAVMRLLEHTVIEELAELTDLDELMQQTDGVVFSRAGDVEKLDKSYSEEAEIMEELYF
ncbi:hypothetical protein LCGC14_1265460 [marine sediment metagenome]|uniref:Peptidase M10 metallopeptidase domain-containing protein n=1 Tax=marine sediment metagenome TaxID=412755 RepID=A0A0F9NGG2_9ZZZZ|nr:hypothetical protein [Desulfobacterales bacterium]